MEKEKITDLLELDLELSRLEGFLAILYDVFEKRHTEMDMAVGSEAREGFVWLVDTMKKIVAGVDIKQIRENIINSYREQQKAQKRQKTQKAEGDGQAKGPNDGGQGS
jgi:hypothetical protein